MKKYLPLMIVTSVVIVVPIILGLILWARLPEQIAIHWNVNGEVDGYAGKAMAVFGCPIFILAIHWICMTITLADPKKQTMSEKMIALALWICPVVSLLLGTVIYMTALGIALNVGMIVPCVLGVLLIVIGNYLPKCTQNYTIGIKTPWALHDAENWHKTHRFAGPVFVVGGMLMIVTALLNQVYVMLVLLLPMVLAPVIYSYILHCKKYK